MGTITVMPLFEFRCSKCGKKFAQLIGMTADSSIPACPRCGGTEVEKLISRFLRLRSEDDKLDALEDAALAGDVDDPRAASRWIREMGKEMDEDLGEDSDEFVEEAERELYDGGDSE